VHLQAIIQYTVYDYSNPRITCYKRRQAPNHTVRTSTAELCQNLQKLRSTSHALTRAATFTKRNIIFSHNDTKRQENVTCIDQFDSHSAMLFERKSRTGDAKRNKKRTEFVLYLPRAALE